MKQLRFTEKQIIEVQREADACPTMADLVRKHGISVQLEGQVWRSGGV
jgi:hypothetical protein